MSYDMGIGNKDFNYTWNVGDMWYAWNDKGIRAHYGKTGQESLPILGSLLAYMVVNKEELEKMNPDNGWGSYEGALDFVKRLLDAAVDNPEEIWEVD